MQSRQMLVADLVEAPLRLGEREQMVEHRAHLARRIACGAAAEVPPKLLSRHALGNGTGATKSGLGCGEFGPHEL